MCHQGPLTTSWHWLNAVASVEREIQKAFKISNIHLIRDINFIITIWIRDILVQYGWHPHQQVDMILFCIISSQLQIDDDTYGFLTACVSYGPSYNIYVFANILEIRSSNYCTMKISLLFIPFTTYSVKILKTFFSIQFIRWFIWI